MTLTTPKPLDPNPWSPITDVRKPDLEVTQESAWRKKDTSYRIPARSETEKEMEERKNYDTSVLMFFSLSEDRNIPPAITLSKKEREAFIISRNCHLLEGPILLHMYSILHSTHPPSDSEVEEVFKAWNWPRKQDRSLLSAVRILKINKKGKI